MVSGERNRLTPQTDKGYHLFIKLERETLDG